MSFQMSSNFKVRRLEAGVSQAAVGFEQLALDPDPPTVSIVDAEVQVRGFGEAPVLPIRAHRVLPLEACRFDSRLGTSSSWASTRTAGSRASAGNRFTAKAAEGVEGLHRRDVATEFPSRPRLEGHPGVGMQFAAEQVCLWVRVVVSVGPDGPRYAEA